MHPYFLEIGAKVSVVIPTLNEEKTVGSVVSELFRSEWVGEIIVVDNGSTDNSVINAQNAGAQVLQVQKKGYGKAIKEGVSQITYPWFVKIDADITNPSYRWIDLLVQKSSPNCALVKGWWKNDNDPMPVTNLVAKPLLKNFFPLLQNIHLPLSGIYLSEKSFVQSSDLNDDWSFTIGLLIKASNSKKEINQTYLGEVYDTLKPVSNYSDMAYDLIRFVSSFSQQKNKTYLVVVAHPDDAEIWCGGTIINAVMKGHNVHILIATGDSKRQKEAIYIKNTFPSIDIKFLKCKEFDNFVSSTHINVLEKIIQDIKPDVLITHHYGDRHMDHANCYKLVESALIKLPRELSPESIYLCQSYFGELRPDTIGDYSTFIDISSVAELKYRMISNHSSQDTSFWIEMISNLDKINGMKTGVFRAEAFQKHHIFRSCAEQLL